MNPQHSATISDEMGDAHQVLDELDAEGRSHAHHWIELRASTRQPVRARCYVRYADDCRGSTVAVRGLTRDLSRGGLGFISGKHFQRHLWVGVTLELQQDTQKYLTGTVCYSRIVRTGWYLTGIQFGKTDDKRLADAPEDAEAELIVPETSTDERSAAAPSSSSRQRTLDMLAAASAMRSFSPETITKVVLASTASDYTIRLAAIPVLMGVPTCDGVKALIRLLDDENPDVQGRAAQALGSKKASEAIDPLRKLLRSSDDTVALHAAEAMARLGDNGGIRAVARIIKSNPSAARQAVRTLGVIVGKSFPAGADGTASAIAYIKSKGLVAGR